MARTSFPSFASRGPIPSILVPILPLLYSLFIYRLGILSACLLRFWARAVCCRNVSIRSVSKIHLCGDGCPETQHLGHDLHTAAAACIAALCFWYSTTNIAHTFSDRIPTIRRHPLSRSGSFQRHLRKSQGINRTKPHWCCDIIATSIGDVSQVTNQLRPQSSYRGLHLRLTLLRLLSHWFRSSWYYRLHTEVVDQTCPPCRRADISTSSLSRVSSYCSSSSSASTLLARMSHNRSRVTSGPGSKDCVPLQTRQRNLNRLQSTNQRQPTLPLLFAIHFLS